MARFEGPRGRNKDSRSRDFEDSGRSRDFEDRPRRSSSSRSGGSFNRNSGSSSRNSSNRRDFEMTKVVCDSCGKNCEVPFKPTSNKPVFCSDCFSKNNKGGSNNNHSSSVDLSEINEKLDKIMHALEISKD